MPRKQQARNYSRTFAELAERVALASNPANELYNCHSELFKDLLDWKPSSSHYLSTFLEQQGKEAVANYILLVSAACGKTDKPRFYNSNAWDVTIQVHPLNPVAYAASLDVDHHKY